MGNIDEVIEKIRELNFEIATRQEQRDTLIRECLRDNDITWEQFEGLYNHKS